MSITLTVSFPFTSAATITGAITITIARGSAMECASHLDVMRVDELIDAENYKRGVELLERIVAMLTQLIDP